MKILILGAGIYQVPLIKKARELGHEVVVCSIEGNYPGFMYADKVYYVDTTSKEEVLKIAQMEEINAIVTTGTDVAVRTIGYVCEKLNLYGVSERCAELVTDKALMKQAFIENGVRTAPFFKVRSLEEAIAACQQMEYPVMFKCVDKSGSRGISKVVSSEEIINAFEYSFSYTNKDYIVVEKFVEGNEIGIDGFVTPDSKAFIPHSKITFHNGLTDVPIGHALPFEMPIEVKEDLISQVQLALKAVGLENGFFNADIIVSENKSYIIELGARTGATCIPEIISQHYDVDYYEMMLKHSLGGSICLSSEPKKACIGEILVSTKTGVVSALDAELVNRESDLEVSFDCVVGDHIRKFKVGPDRIGQIIASADCLEEAREKIDYAKSKMIVDLIEEN